MEVNASIVSLYDLAVAGVGWPRIQTKIQMPTFCISAIVVGAREPVIYSFPRFSFSPLATRSQEINKIHQPEQFGGVSS